MCVRRPTTGGAGWRTRVWLRVLGSAAGGGFPQWNCGCPACRAVRDGSRPCRSRTQSSIVVSADYRRWFLINASPDIRAQIESFPRYIRVTAERPLCRRCCSPTPSWTTRSDCCYCARARALELHPPPRYETLCDGTSLLRTLERYCPVNWRPVVLDVDVSLGDGLSYRGLVPTTKPARFGPGSERGRVVGYRLTDEGSGKAAVYLPGVQELTPAVREQLDDCACLLFDGTCWHDDELIQLGLARKDRTTWDTCRSTVPMAASSTCQRFPSAQDLRPYQQHQSDPAGRRAERRRVEGVDWKWLWMG